MVGQGIELGEYDRETNKYEVPTDSPLNELRASYFWRTSLVQEPFGRRDGK